MSSFQDKLKALYQRQDRIAPLIEGLEKEIRPQTLDYYYVKLQTIIREDDQKKSMNYEAISGRKQEIEIENLFDPLPSEENSHKGSVNKLLVLGAAGAGKSTLMQYIVHKWSKGELWNDKFDYVYKVSLKTLLNRDWDRSYDAQQREDDILKCLVHFQLVAELHTQERRDFQLQEMPWFDKEDRILLLLDGYDEVAHTSRGFYKRLLQDIFEHKNLILTSRPNALDKEMAEKFGRKIEINGFDLYGIDQYLTQYFKNDKDKGFALKEFLQKNSSIKEICQIPVNIAMMCFIWSQGNSNETLQKVSNMSDLYSQVVDHLGFRYYASQSYMSKYSDYELQTRWRGGEIQLDELRVLQHTAYKGMTGGGVEVSDDQRFETLIIPGMIRKEDRDGISIQSSINYLSNELKRDMLTINKVYQFGLLRSEGSLMLQESKKKSSDTDLHSHYFTFIHRSFQEFLTAQYFAKKLREQNNTREQENIASFIAQHRNEPRYFMTLKFMAGIFSSANSDKAEQGTKIFWDAVMCNPDGILELGVETKVLLLMHLLSQTTREKKIIPNKDLAMDLIDSVVLRDLSGWSLGLQESDYTSYNIQTGLLEYSVYNNVTWISQKSFELQRKINPKFKDGVPGTQKNVEMEEIIDTIDVLIHKFSKPEQNKFFLKVLELLRKYTERKWRLTKKAIEFFIHHKEKLEINTYEEKVRLDHLLITVYDSNLNEVSCKALGNIINTSQNLLYIKTVSEKIKEDLQNMKLEMQYSKIWVLSSILQTCNLKDIRLVQDVIHILTSFFKNSDWKVKISASRHILELMKKNDDSAFNSRILDDVINTLIELLEKYNFKEVTDSASKYLVELIRINGNSTQLIRDTIDRLTRSMEVGLKNRGDPVSVIIQLIQVNSGNNILLTQHALNNLIPRLASELFVIYSSIRDVVQKLIKIGAGDLEFIQETLNIFIRCLQNTETIPGSDFFSVFIDSIEISSHHKTQLIRETIKSLTPLLSDSQGPKRFTLSETIIRLMWRDDNIDLQMARVAFNDIIRLLQDSHPDIRNYGPAKISHLLEKTNRNELVQDVLNTCIRIFQDSKEDDSNPILRTIIALIEISVKSGNQLDKGVLNNLIQLLHNSQKSIRNWGSLIIIRLIEVTPEKHSHLARNVLDTLAPLLKDYDKNIQKIAFDNIIKLMHSSHDAQLTKDIFSVLDPFFEAHHHWNIGLQIQETIGMLMETRNDTQLVKDIINILILLMRESNHLDRRVTYYLINQLLKTNDTQIIFNHLTPYLHDFDPKVKNQISETLIKLMKLTKNNDIGLAQDILSTLIPLLKTKIIQERRPALENAFEIMELCSLKNIQFFTEALEILTPFLESLSSKVRAETSKDIVALVRKSDPKFAGRAFKNLTQLLQDPKKTTRNAASATIIRLMDLCGESGSRLTREVFNILIPLLKDPDQNERKFAAQNLLELMRLSASSSPQLLNDCVKTSIELLQFPNQESDEQRVFNTSLKTESINETAEHLLRSIVSEIFLRDLDSLAQYFNHPSKSFRNILISSLLDCLKASVQNFELLEQLFQNPKSPLNQRRIKEHFIQMKESESFIKETAIVFEKLQDKSFSMAHFPELKSLLLSEFKKIGVLKGPQIIELAMLVISGEKVFEEGSNDKKLVETAKNVLNVQIKYLDDDGLIYIQNNYEKLISLSPETKSFYRKVCHKILEDEKITPLEERLFIKFINQGFTNLLTRKGEIIFEGKRYHLKGENIEQAFEKIAKSIIDQQPDILALQYKDHEPMFCKSNVQGGMKEAAADKKEVRSIVDKRFLLKDDFWLLTILNSLINPQLNIIILEKRNAFGDHFIFRFNDERIFRFYPNELPELKQIFGSYRYRELYKGKVVELTEEVGQKLFESKNVKDIDNIEGNELSKQTYFQQELLREGNEDRDYWTGKELEKKLNDNRKLLEKKFQSLKISDDDEKRKIQEYYEGFVSTFSTVFTSSQTIAVGKVAIDDGTNYFSIINIFFQLKSFDPFCIGDISALGLNGVQNHLKSTPIMNDANSVNDIAIDEVELSDLAGKTVLDIISDLASRQRIFDAKAEQLANNFRNNVKTFVLNLLEKLKGKVKEYTKMENLFLEKIENTPAFQLGEDDANRVIRKWIELKKSKPDLRLKPKEKRKIFVKVISENLQPNPANKQNSDQCNLF